ncbi:hypothetical protein J3998_05825 [Thiomicrorhabdus sp. 6S2-11]|uniref:Carboxypeptidase regulatory-like domain-containing protein n=1 Tax=Thiomicrorhabdus marina TaxID=2818442 RepID=A0ABS3Q496_9GAMM|nr:hypothetical protein [Thiomicrorhabdus marina]MBO1927091.1 hypothetical protein [Thiomicrorhabdus marina]
MQTIIKRILIVPVLIFGLFLTACNNSNPSSNETTPAAGLAGTAATGAPIKGFVFAKDASGNEINIATMLDGSFTLDAANLTAPIVLKVVSEDGLKTYYSFAETNNQTVNITPLTHLALFLAVNKINLDTLYDDWDGSNITLENVLVAQAKINANLRDQITEKGLDPNSYNFLTTPFVANSTGFDKLLDEIRVSVDLANSSFSFEIPALPNFTFDEAISVDGISFENSNPSNGLNESPATILAEHAKQYTFTFTESAPGSGIADGTQRTFALGTDGSLVIDGSTTLTNPVLYKGNPYEAIWTDNTNNLKYAASSIVTGETLREINISNNLNYDQTGFKFYGQFNDASSNNSGSTCSGTYGSVTLSGEANVTALTGTEFCPGAGFEVPERATAIYFTDNVIPNTTRKGGIIALQVHYTNNLFDMSPGFIQLKYTQDGTIVYEKYLDNGTLNDFNITIDADTKTVNFNNTVLPAKACNTCTGEGTMIINGSLIFN